VAQLKLVEAVHTHTTTHTPRDGGLRSETRCRFLVLMGAAASRNADVVPGAHNGKALNLLPPLFPPSLDIYTPAADVEHSLFLRSPSPTCNLVFSPSNPPWLKKY